MTITEREKLKKLCHELMAEGCNKFYIPGISKTLNDDVVCLNLMDGNWKIYYTERGIDSEPIYSTYDIDDAIQYYKNYITSQEHWHLIIITRSIEKINEYRSILELNGIKIIQNDMPDYSKKDDRVFRLFVTNKDIFRAEKLFRKIPYSDL